MSKAVAVGLLATVIGCGHAADHGSGDVLDLATPTTVVDLADPRGDLARSFHHADLATAVTADLGVPASAPGTLLWAKSYLAYQLWGNKYASMGGRVLVDSGGFIYAAGAADDSTGLGSGVVGGFAKLSADGSNVAWAKFGASAAFALDESGYGLVTGGGDGNLVAAYPPAGGTASQTWTGSIADARGGKIAVVAGGVMTMRDSAGTVLWTAPVTEVDAMRVGPDGSVAFFGLQSSGGWTVTRLDAAGKASMQKEYSVPDGGTSGSLVLRDLAIGPAGETFLAGYRYDPSTDGIAIKLDESGNEVWRVLLPQAYLTAVAMDGAAPVVAGSSFANSSILCVAFDSAGNARWRNDASGWSSTGAGVAVANGLVYANGTRNFSQGDSALMIAQYVL